jgi:hypothetical protein
MVKSTTDVFKIQRTVNYVYKRALQPLSHSILRLRFYPKNGSTMPDFLALPGFYKALFLYIEPSELE